MYNLKINDFTDKLSSAAPVPGGGGASALMGGIASSLCSMVANLTTGKKKYAEYQPDIDRILETVPKLTEEILELINKDAEAFEPLSKAYSIPKDQEGRDELLENALRVASDAPFAIVEKMVEVTDLIEELTIKGSRLAISDVGVAACACAAAVRGASMNVFINTKLMKDREYAASMNEKTISIVNDVVERCDKAYKTVLEGLM